MNFFRLVLAIGALLICPVSVQASGPTPYATITVKGMVCSFCVQGVEKKLTELKGVEKVSVNLKQKTVSVWVAENASLTDLQMRNAIRSAGYNIEAIKRNGTNPKIKSRMENAPSQVINP